MSSSPAGAEQAAPGPRRRRALVVGPAVLGVLVVALLVWALTRGGGTAADGDPDTADPTGAASPVPSASAPATPEPSADPTADPDATPEPGTPPAPTGAVPVAPDTALPEPLAPRALTEEVPLGEQAVARVLRLEAVEGAPQGVGEVAGPALRFAIELENTGSEPLPVGDAVVNVTYGPEATPAIEISGPGRVPFTGELPPGESATGVYVFLVPPEARDVVSVTLEYRFGAPIAVFEGSASAAPAG